MARLTNSCCFCFSLSQGYVNLLYLDIGRIFIGLLYLVLTFTNNFVSSAEQTFTVLNFLAILFQSFQAFKTLNKGMRENRIQSYYWYLISKICYNLAHFLLNVIFLIVKCNAISTEKSCNVPNYSLSVFTGIIWWMIEFYFLFICYSFYSRAKRGEYGPPGSLPDFMAHSEHSFHSRTKKAIVIEGKGLKPKHLANITDDEIQISIPVEMENADTEFGVKAEVRDLVGTMRGNRKYSLFKLN